MDLEQFVGEAEAREHPERHSEPAVDEPLDVQAEDPWIQLSAPYDVSKKRSDRARVSGRWNASPLMVRKMASDIPKMLRGVSSRNGERRGTCVVRSIYEPTRNRFFLFLVNLSLATKLIKKAGSCGS